MGASRDHAPAAAAATPSALPGSVIRYGRWSIERAGAGSFPYIFTHDEFNGAPDVLDPRHGYATSVSDCLARIGRIEASGSTDDGEPFDVTQLTAAELRAISDLLVAEGLLAKTTRGAGYALTARGRERRAARRALRRIKATA